MRGLGNVVSARNGPPNAFRVHARPQGIHLSFSGLHGVSISIMKNIIVARVLDPWRFPDHIGYDIYMP